MSLICVNSYILFGNNFMTLSVIICKFESIRITLNVELMLMYKLLKVQ